MPAVRQQIALIIPAFNEAPVLPGTLARIPAGLFDLVVVADNGSTDGTGAVSQAAGAAVVRTEERGYGAACLAALRALPREISIVVFIQADGSEDPADARMLLTPIEDGRADLVLGSRVLGEAEPGALLPHQRFGNWLATALIRVFYGHRYSDLGPFRAIRRASLEQLDMQDRNYGWTVEMQIRALKQGLRVMEIPVRYGVRSAGEHKVSGNLRASVRAGWKILSVVARSLAWRHRATD